MKQKYIDFYMRVAEEAAKMSDAVRLQVGAILVRDNRILTYGFNGMPTGWDNCCEHKEWCDAGGFLSPEEIEQQWPYQGVYLDSLGNEIEGRYRLKSNPEVLHAETNAIAKIARSTDSSEGAVLFCTHAPCIDCAKIIHQAGIIEVIFRDDYRSEAGLKFLKASGVKVSKYEYGVLNER